MQRQSCLVFHALSIGERIFKIAQQIKILWDFQDLIWEPMGDIHVPSAKCQFSYSREHNKARYSAHGLLVTGSWHSRSRNGRGQT